MSNTVLKAALAGVLSVGVVMSAMAAPVPADPTKDKCFGIAKAGKNDCASATGAHSCAGLASKDKDAGDWNYVAKGDCAKMGGKLEAPAAVKKS